MAAWALAAACLCLLSVSLVGVDLQPGKARFAASGEGSASGGAGLPAGPSLARLFRVIVVVCLALVPVSIVVHLFSPEGRQRLVADLIALALILALYALVSSSPRPPAEGETGANVREMTVADAAAPEQPEADVPPPAWLVRAVVIGLSLAAAALIAAAVATVVRRRPRDLGSLPELGGKAEDALTSLRSGADLRDVVIRCYAEMTETVERDRGIHRDSFMTPREFEHVLVDRGLPSGAVHSLTRVFEEVRYAAASPGPESEARARASLTEIAAACRRDA